MKKVRMIDVALHAGVSKSTVSQYVNGNYHYMSEETRNRITEAIQQLNYIPNPIARSLKTNKTYSIGVIIRDITGYFSSRVIRGIDDFCKTHNYNVSIYNTDYDFQAEKKALQLLKQMRVDGIIIASSGINNPLIEKEAAQGLPIVQVNQEYSDLKTSRVLSDYRAGAYMGTEYLIKLGHRRIAPIMLHFTNCISRRDRLLGYQDALRDYNIPYDESLIYYWDRNRSFEKPFSSILNRPAPPTALFPMHLAITLDTLRQLQATKKQIPKDISLLGFDEIPMADLLRVPITVVQQAPYAIGQEATKLLLTQIDQESTQMERVILPCSLAIRESCRSV